MVAMTIQIPISLFVDRGFVDRIRGVRVGGRGGGVTDGDLGIGGSDRGRCGRRDRQPDTCGDGEHVDLHG